jgi:hypothetical protein
MVGTALVDNGPEWTITEDNAASYSEEAVRAPIAENASWCDVFCRAQGITGTFGPRAWTSPHRTPEYYPDAVTLDPAATPADILPLIDASPGCTVAESWPRAVAAVASAFPGMPVVGYERGETLEAALAHGAEPLGPLRVWLRG